MIARLVQTTADAECVRQLRNAGREWMTNDTHEITPEEQQNWWSHINPTQVHLWLYDNENTVGFGMLRWEDNRWWLTLAVHPLWRGKGFGTSIYQHLRQQTPEVWCRILENNIASLKAAQHAGFQIITTGPIYTLYSSTR